MKPLYLTFACLLIICACCISCDDKESLPEVVADFSADPLNATVGESIQFSDKSSGDPTKWAWTFESAEPSTSSIMNPVVVYHQPGTYSVTLTASNAEKTSTITKEELITVLPVVKAIFAASDTVVNTTQLVTFSDMSEGEPTAWNWEFEAGTPSTSTERNPTVAYNTSGIFIVKLTVSNALSSNAITKNLYMAVIPTAGLRGFYQLDGDFNDASGNAFHGTFLGEPIHHSFSTDRHGQSDKASRFSGNGGAISLGNEAGNNIRTISLWISPDVTIDNDSKLTQRILGRGCTCDKGFILEFDERILRFNLYDDFTGINLVSQKNWPANEWFHIAIVLDPTKGSMLYVNGHLEFTRSTALASTGTIDAITAIDQWGPLASNHFRGKIDQVRLYESALSQKEITALSRE